MSTLRQALEVRPTANVETDNPCHAIKPQAPALFVEPGGGVRWVFPWTHFLHGRHECGNADEQVVLTFTSHEVAVHGRNLGPLLAAAAGLRLEKLRAVPGDYGASADAEPIVTRITLRASDEPAPPAEEARAPARPAHSIPCSA